MTDLFTFTSTSARNIGTRANSSYVWGINRGGETAGFAANGLPNVLSDRDVQLVPVGISRIAGGELATIDLPTNLMTFNGATITAIIPASLLPSNGFTSRNYTVNVIADFALNTNNVAVTVIPAPGVLGMIGGIAVFGLRRRR